MLKAKWRVAALVALALIVPVMASAVEGRFERTLQVSANPEIVVNTGSGSIKVRSGPGNSVQIIGIVRSNSWFGGGEEAVREIEKNPPIVQTGNYIKIGRNEDSSWLRNISISYELVVPASTRLSASTGSGGHEITDIAGPVTANSGSGHIRLARIRGDVKATTGSGGISASEVAGRFVGNTGSGSIDVRNSEVVDADVHTGSGGITVQSVSGRLKARAGSGSIDVMGRPTAAWDLDTGSGSVKLNVPPELGFDVDLHTSSGGINVAREVTTQGQADKHRMQAKVKGGGPLVKVSTGSGSIDLR